MTRDCGGVWRQMADKNDIKIIIKESPIHGLGVFARQDIVAGETLERCAYIVIDDDDLQETNRLNDYLFTSPDDPNDYLVVMGCGMLYNHGVPANAKWEVDETDNGSCGSMPIVTSVPEKKSSMIMARNTGPPAPRTSVSLPPEGPSVFHRLCLPQARRRPVRTDDMSIPARARPARRTAS